MKLGPQYQMHPRKKRESNTQNKKWNSNSEIEIETETETENEQMVHWLIPLIKSQCAFDCRQMFLTLEWNYNDTSKNKVGKPGKSPWNWWANFSTLRRCVCVCVNSQVHTLNTCTSVAFGLTRLGLWFKFCQTLLVVQLKCQLTYNNGYNPLMQSPLCCWSLKKKTNTMNNSDFVKILIRSDGYYSTHD